jgi:hypothetical protein
MAHTTGVSLFAPPTMRDCIPKSSTAVQSSRGLDAAIALDSFWLNRPTLVNSRHTGLAKGGQDSPRRSMDPARDPICDPRLDANTNFCPTCISDRISAFRTTWRFSHLVAAAVLVFRQGRVFEILHAAYCFLTLRPSRIQPDQNVDIQNLTSKAIDALRKMQSRKRKVVHEINQLQPGSSGAIRTLIHGFSESNNTCVLGEYGEGSARIFMKTTDSFKVVNPYATDSAVRHIHLLLRKDDQLLVSTGDSRKCLDLFSVRGDALRFEKRLLHRTGGFTAGCFAGGKTYLGTDFGETPNYIYCLETKKKYPFPAPAYRQYSILLLPLDDRFLICSNVSIRGMRDKRHLSIFDTHTARFIHCEERKDAELFPCTP